METVSRDEIITDALELCGAIAAGDEPSDEDAVSVGRSLNFLIKAWQTEGINVWAISSIPVALEQGTVEYSLSERPIRILNGVWRNESDVDIPLTIWSREEYWRLSNKNSEGSPLNVFYDRKKEEGILYVWQAPRDDNQELILQAQVGLDTSLDNVDFPAEYFLALSYNLARVIAPKYGLPIADSNRIERIAYDLYEDALGYNRGDTSLYLEPDNQGGRYGYN